MDNEQEAPRRGRPPKDRAEETRKERRRKRGDTVHSGIRLAVDMSKLDTSNYEYRWVNDTAGRPSRLYEEDWAVAPEMATEANDGLGTVQSKNVGTQKSGQPMSGILMRKPKDWYNEDQRDKQRPLDQIEHEIRTGTAHERGEPELRDRNSVYTPNGANILDRR